MKSLSLLPCLVLFLFVFSCSAPEKKEVEKAEDIKGAFILQKQAVSKTLSLPAELIAYERAEITAKVEGYVQKVAVDIGDRVKKGQVLAILDAPEVMARHAEARAKYHEAEARYTGSRDQYERIQRAAQHPGVVAESERIQAKNQTLADSAAWVSAGAAVRVYSQLQDYLTLRAPFDGKITHRAVDPGDYVGSPGKAALLTLERPDLLRLRVHVPESYVNSIPSDQPMTFTADAAVERSFAATLARKSGSIDRETRSERWEYAYDNRDGTLKPGMYALAQIHLSRPTGSFVVPYPAVVTSMEKKFVARVHAGKVEWVDVREGIAQEKGIEIFGDLREGDTLLHRGSEEFKPGMAVSIRVQD